MIRRKFIRLKDLPLSHIRTGLVIRDPITELDCELTVIDVNDTKNYWGLWKVVRLAPWRKGC